jgi:hypothetical protein
MAGRRNLGLEHFGAWKIGENVFCVFWCLISERVLVWSLS